MPEEGAASSSRLRRIERGVAYVLGGLTLLVGAVLLALQFETMSTAVVRQAAEQFNPLEGTTLSVGAARGSWLTTLELEDVTLSRVDSTTGDTLEMAHVDTVRARYRLAGLLAGEVHVSDLQVAGPRATLRQAADSSWDWQRVLPAASEDTSTSQITVRIDRTRLRRGAATARFYSPRVDSVAQVRDLTMRLDSVLTGPGVSGLGVRAKLDTLGLRATVPGDTASVRFGTRLAVRPSALQLDTLLLQSPRSRVEGGGVARVRPGGSAEPAVEPLFDDVDLRVQARPLSFRDLSALLPIANFDPTETLSADLRLTGSGHEVSLYLDGRFEDGGRVNVDATATPRLSAGAVRDAASTGAETGAASPPFLRYRVDATVDRLTTSLLGPRDTTANRISARLEADLDGPSLDRLDGPLSLTVTDTRYATVRTPSLRLSGRLRDGRASYEIDGTVNEARIDADGTGRFFADLPTYRLDARIEQFDASQFAEGAPATDVASRFQVNGRGVDGSALRADLRLDLDPSRVGAQSVTGGQVRAAVTPNSARAGMRLDTQGGQLRVAGRVALDGSERFRIDTARVERFNLAGLVEDTTASALTATLQADGRGFDPGAMRLDGTLDVRDSYYGTVRVGTLDAGVQMRGGELSASVQAQVNGGSWAFGASGAPFAAEPSVQISGGRFRDVDAGRFAVPATPPDTASTAPLQTDLRGRFRATLTGSDPERLSAEATVELDSSQVNDQPVPSARFSAQLEEGTLDAVLDWNAAADDDAASSRIVATGRPFDAVPVLEITDGTFQSLNVGALSGISGVETNLSGTLTGRVRGLTPETIDAQAELSLSASTINRATLTGGRLSVRADTGAAAVDARFDVGGGRLTLAARASSLRGTPSYQIESQAETLDLAALAGVDTTQARLDSLRWTLDGTGGSVNRLSAQTQLTASGLHIDALQVETVNVRGRLDGGRLNVDTLLATSNTFRVDGGGSVAFRRDDGTRSDFKFTAEATDLRPLRRIAGVQRLRASSALVTGRIYGPPGRLRFNAESSLESLVVDNLRLADLSLRAAGTQGTDEPLSSLEITGELGYLSLPSIAVRGARVTALYDSSLADLNLQVDLDDRRSARLDAVIDPRPEAQRITLNRLDARLGNDAWQLLQEASISYGSAYRINGLLLYSDTRQIAADGRIDPDGTQSLVATIENFRIGSIADLVGLDGLDGEVDGTLSLSGEASAPTMQGQLNLDVRTADRNVGDLQLNLDYDDLALGVDARLKHQDGQTLTAVGSVPVDLRLSDAEAADVSDRPVNLQIQTEAFPVDWIDPFVDPALVTGIAGSLSADVQVGGTLGTPDVRGTTRLTGGTARLTDLEVEYRRARSTLTFDGGQVRMTDTEVFDDDGGRLSGSGTIDLADLTLGRFDLDLSADDFVAIDTRAYRSVRVDGGLQVSGTTRQPVVGGDLTVLQGDIYAAETAAESGSELANVPLTDEDQLLLEQRFNVRISEADTTTFDAYQALALDVEVEIRRDTWLRQRANPEMNVQFTGSLNVDKASGSDAQVFGTIDVVTERSTIRQFGQQFRIEEGTLTFNGDPTEPYLRLTAVYEKQSRLTSDTEVRITLSAQGRPDDLDLQLSSQPQMDTRNILSYLATGQPASQLLGGGSGGGTSNSTGDLAENLAIGQLTSLAENFAASNVGLDVVRIQYQPDGGSYFVLGRYLTPRFYAAIEQPVSVNDRTQGSTSSLAPDLTFEYELTDTLLMRLQSRQQSLRFNLLFEYAY